MVNPWNAGDTMSAPPLWPCMDPTMDALGSMMGFEEPQMPWTSEQQSWEAATFVDLSAEEPATASQESSVAPSDAVADWASARAELAKHRAPGFRLEGLDTLEDSLRKLILQESQGLSQAASETTSAGEASTPPSSEAPPNVEAIGKEQGVRHITAI